MHGSMECCCHVWADTPGYNLELLDKLQKWICRNASPSLAAPLEPLAHRRNVSSLSVFYRYYFRICLSELAEPVPLLYSRGRSTRYSDRLHDLPSLFLNVTRMLMSIVSFLTQLDSGTLCL